MSRRTPPEPVDDAAETALRLTWCSCLACRAVVAASRLRAHRQRRCAAHAEHDQEMTEPEAPVSLDDRAVAFAVASGQEQPPPPAQPVPDGRNPYIAQIEALVAEQQTLYRLTWRSPEQIQRLRQIAGEIATLEEQKRLWQAQRNGIAELGPAAGLISTSPTGLYRRQ